MDKGLFIVILALAGVVLVNILSAPPPFEGKSELIHIEGSNFESEVLANPLPVLADFTSSTCGQCRRMSPDIERLAVHFKERVRVAKINVEKNPHIADRYGIRELPRLVIFADGKPVHEVRPGRLRKMIAAVEESVANN
ncbi:MAG: thioredoxin domain-containing protein [Verrucomicrobiota bacterium]